MKSIYGCCLVLVASMGLMACDAGIESKATAAPGKKSYTLTDREKAIVTTLLVDEIDGSANGRDIQDPELVRKILGDYVVTTSANLQTEYERNEVAGDQKFRKKLLLINGTVKSIDRSVGENYFIALRGGSNPYITPKAAMADGYTNFLAQLQKGQQVELACQGNGMLIGSAMLSNCEPLLNYAGKKANAFVSRLSIGDAIAAADVTTQLMAVYGAAFAASLPDSSICFAQVLDWEKCGAELMSFSNTKGKEKEIALQAAVNAAIEKMGVDKNALKVGNAAPAASASK